jgi:hypothetical protein
LNFRKQNEKPTTLLLFLNILFPKTEINAKLNSSDAGKSDIFSAEQMMLEIVRDRLAVGLNVVV